MADLFDKLQARRDGGILAVPAETRRPLTNAWKEEVLEDLVQGARRNQQTRGFMLSPRTTQARAQFYPNALEGAGTLKTSGAWLYPEPDGFLREFYGFVQPDFLIQRGWLRSSL